MSAVAFDPQELRRWLELVWPDDGRQLHGRITVSHSGPDGFRADRAVYPLCRDDVVEIVRDLDVQGMAGIYLGNCTVHPDVRPPARGTVDQTMDAPGLWLDADFAGPGHADRPEDHLPHPPDEQAAHKLIAAAPLVPTAVVHSGGGLYPWWMFDQAVDLTDADTRARVAALSRRWSDHMVAQANGLGWHLDSVPDLARVMRAPGTVNLKVPDDPRPCRIVSCDGPRYTLADVEGALDAAGAPRAHQGTLGSRKPSSGAEGDPFAAPAGAFEGNPPASRADVLRRVRFLADDLAGWGKGANHRATQLASMVGQYVSADQIEQDVAEEIMLGALAGWEYTTDCTEATMHHTITRQIAHGMTLEPYVWRAGDRIDEPVPPTAEAAGGAAPLSGSGRHLRLVPASSIKIRRTRWTWEGRVPAGSLVLLAGREGLGKSTVGYWLAARITRGELPGEHLGAPMAVLVCATEDSWSHTIVPRLVAHGADLERVFRVDVLSADEIEVGLSLPADLAGIEEAAREQGAALLLLDPLMSRLDAGLDTHKDAEVRRALEPLTVMADRTGMAVVGLIHLNKSGGSDALNQVMASRAFPAVARAVLHVVPDPDDETDRRRLLALSKNNLGRTDLPLMPFTIENFEIETDDDGTVRVGQIAWQEEIEGTIRDVMQRAEQDSDSRSASSEAGDWLEDWLAQRGGEAASQDAKKAGMAEGHSQDALKRAVKQRKGRLGYRSEGMPRRTIWFLTP